ncbi:hypothetical protein GQ53DRAFT_755204 [Thozetella sp. PMI_491]|nr:hypothetical protein GQ53DRAFT_755204 [Thozetella sp. PMI_491]
MRIRLPFAGVFFLLLLIAGYAGLTSLAIDTYINDKVLHLLTFFLLTIAFYWIIDTNRRRTLNLTLIVCTAGLSVGSEVLQHLLPNDREFDIQDILANVVGSLAGLGLCSWYHKRMLERKRQQKQYNAVPGEDDEEEDLELGEGVGGGHEEGVADSGSGAGTGDRNMTLEEEVDNWDENAVDAWDEDDLGDIGTTTATGKGTDTKASAGDGNLKKRDD